MALPYQQNIALALRALGISETVLRALLDSKKEEILTFAEQIKSGELPAFTHALMQEDLVTLMALAENWQARFSHIVFLGTGGSSLGAQALVGACGKPGGPAPIFLDNVDPETLERTFSVLPLKTTGVVCISKSGSTVETLLQTLLFIQKFKEEGLTPSSHFCGVTEDTANPLRDICEKEKISIINHPKDVGGRFSVLTLVGLLPALSRGVNGQDVRQGAEKVMKDFLKNPLSCTPALGAALAVIAEEKGKGTHVLMPYGDSLRKFGEWFVQLWAESLGKGGKGTLPVSAIGSTDQHSILQLFYDGPNDKFFTFILPTTENTGTKISPATAKNYGLDFYKNLSAGTLLAAQGHATVDSLVAQGRVVRQISTPQINEEVIGALLAHFMLEVALAGVLMGVDPFDQPGVEDSKRRTREYLSSKESKKKDLH